MKFALKLGAEWKRFRSESGMTTGGGGDEEETHDQVGHDGKSSMAYRNERKHLRFLLKALYLYIIMYI